MSAASVQTCERIIGTGETPTTTSVAATRCAGREYSVHAISHTPLQNIRTLSRNMPPPPGHTRCTSDHSQVIATGETLEYSPVRACQN